MDDQHLEHKYSQYMRHYFATYQSHDDLVANKRALQQQMHPESLLAKKSSYARLLLKDMESFSKVAQTYLEYIEQQLADLSDTRLDVVKNPSYAIPLPSLNHHRSLLKQYYGRYFLDAVNAAYLGDNAYADEQPKHLSEAAHAVHDAAHVQRLIDVLKKQYQLVKHIVDRISLGSSHRLQKAYELLCISLEDEQLHLGCLHQQSHVYASWISAS